ncbi:MAG: hypothetical protein IJG33_03130 [Selenomonadaceae bacterium]|nr:hypothetical protein [Selenomonadaceae bacterium]
MMKIEFVKRTGYKPTAEEYKAIEAQYYDFDGDKNTFCRNWRAEMLRAERDTAAAINRLMIAEAEKHGCSTPYFLKLKELFFLIS